MRINAHKNLTQSHGKGQVVCVLVTQHPLGYIKKSGGSFPSPPTGHLDTGGDFLDDRGTQDSAPPSIEDPDP